MKSMKAGSWYDSPDNREALEFKSSIYSSIDEYNLDLDRMRRDESYVRIKGKLCTRSPYETEQIKLDKINAARRLDVHFENGGTALDFKPLF